MRLSEAIAAAGMTPPLEFLEGRWMRFPGIGKKRGNADGYCKLFSHGFAIYGDWASGFQAEWRDDSAVARYDADARRRARESARATFEAQRRASDIAFELIASATVATHPYLAAKGFPDLAGLISSDGQLLVPVRAVEDYEQVLTVQKIAPDGTKRFLGGSRAKGGVHLLGSPKSGHTMLCEGYATGLTLHLAAKSLWPFHCVVIAFSAGNLVTVAPHFPGAIVCADNDLSGTGEKAARDTGLPWGMPPEVGDFNDLYQRLGPVGGRAAVREIIRTIGNPMGNPMGKAMGGGMA